MIEYIEWKRSISDSLAVDDEDLIGYILNGLDSSYGAFVTAFMMKSEVLNVDYLVGLLLQEEARLEQEHLRLASVTQTSVVALNVNRSNSRSSSSYNGSSSGLSNVARGTYSRKKKSICHLCMKPGHKVLASWKSD